LQIGSSQTLVLEAKFGKRKFNKRAYREGMWDLGGVDRNTGQCFLHPCPANRRGAEVLLPLIRHWILPGSIIYTDEWGAYNSLTAEGYTHGSVNRTYQFVGPQTGTTRTRRKASGIT
jgi:transposase-like protein